MPADNESALLPEPPLPRPAARDAAIDDWCRSVWAAYRESRQTIIDLLKDYQIA